MNRRRFLQKTGVAGLLASAWPALAQTTNATARAQARATGGGLAFTTAPSVQGASPTSVTIAIGVNGPSTAWVEYGETPELGRVATGARHGLKPFDAVAHAIRLEGLRPGQACYYRVHACAIDFRNAYNIRRGETVATDVFRFQPLNPKAGEARFAVWNDTHENAATLAQLMTLTAREPADFHVWNGDITNDNYREADMARHYLGAGGQPFSRDTPLLFVRGNHDDRGPAARLLERFQVTTDGRTYYSFAHGPLAGVVLNTGEDKPDDHPVYAGLGDYVAFHREQAAWLAAEIRKPQFRRARFRVAFMHIPVWWVGDRGDGGFANQPADPRAEWHPLLVRGKFHAVISGHTHRHALFPPDAKKPYAQMVGGGPKPEAATLIRGHATARELTLTMTDLAGKELAVWRTRG